MPHFWALGHAAPQIIRARIKIWSGSMKNRGRYPKNQLRPNETVDLG
jgi:hypothetical protein